MKDCWKIYLFKNFPKLNLSNFFGAVDKLLEISKIVILWNREVPDNVTSN